MSRGTTVETGIDPNIAFADGARRFAALVIDTGSAFVYVDGKQTAKTTDDIAPTVTPTPLHLGCHNDDGAYGTKRRLTVTRVACPRLRRAPG